MSLEYAENRIKEALRLHKGHQGKAIQQVIAWTYEDSKLLHALARPHLSGIVGYNVERVASGRAEAKPREKKAEVSKPAPPPKKERFGLELLKAVADTSSAVFGLEDTGVPQKRKSVSQAHIDALKAMAAKSKHTKK